MSDEHVLSDEQQAARMQELKKVAAERHSGRPELWPGLQQIQKVVTASDPSVREKPVYYVGAADDMAVPLALTDAPDYVFVDTEYVHDGEVNERALPDNQIRQLSPDSIAVNIEGELGNGGKRVVTYEWNGARKVTEYAADATSLEPEEVQNGCSVLYISAPTLFGDEIGAIYAPDNLGRLCQTITEQGYLAYWHSDRLLRVLQPGDIGFERVQYDTGTCPIELYQRTREDADLPAMLTLDRELDDALQIRDGRYMQIIDASTLPYFQMTMQSLRSMFDQAGPERKHLILQILRDQFILRKTNRAYVDEVVSRGKGGGIVTDDQSFMSFFTEANGIVEELFPEVVE